MSKVLAIFGATGHQGGSLLNYVLNDPELSKTYKIRAITRDVSSDKVEHLREKVEVVQGDVSDRKSLERALSGAHTVFAMTTPSFGPNPFEEEVNNAVTIAEIAHQQGVQYFIFSTLPYVTEISGGKYTAVAPFDAKAEAEKRIRTLPIKSAFYCPANFMQNFHEQAFLAPRNASDGTWVLSRHVAPKSRFALIDSVDDTGKIVGAILANPDKYEGKRFCAAEGLYTLDEVAAALGKAAGKTVVYKQISTEEFKKGVPVMADIFAEAFSSEEENGYFGPATKEMTAWTAQQARGKLTSLEEYLATHPYKLD